MPDSTGTGSHIRKVLVGTDGSATAAVAVRKAATLAAALDAELVIVSAFSARPPGGGLGTSYTSDAAWAATAEAAAREHVDAAVQAAKEAGVAVASGDAVGGDPADVLLGEAERRDVDLLVVGSKGMQSSSRFLLGSVPNKVSHHSPCDLMIVHTSR
jgi:nucleotide-binding universal stress UspA family protein